MNETFIFWFNFYWRLFLLSISQHWFRQWLGAEYVTAIMWTNADPIHWCIRAALGVRWIKCWYTSWVNTQKTISGLSTQRPRQCEKCVQLSSIWLNLQQISHLPLHTHGYTNTLSIWSWVGTFASLPGSIMLGNFPNTKKHNQNYA